MTPQLPAASPPALSALCAGLARWLLVAAALGAVTAASEPLIWLFKFGIDALGASAAIFMRLTLLNFLDAAAMLVVLALGHWLVTPRVGRPGFFRLALLVFAVAVAGLSVFSASYGVRFDGAPVSALDHPYQAQQHLTFALLFVIAFEFSARSRAAGEALHATSLQRLALEREMASAQLQLLQAQVEPHFLFNTLANLRRLVRTDRSAARAMLGDLMRYLETALPRLRDERSTLAREVALVRAYLAVHQVRMGARLRVEIDVPDALGERDVPPMALLTLVENALKHGVQPLVEGATVRVAAQVLRGQLLLTVADTGQGMGSGSGSGSGLANLRARLRALYGGAASLTLQVNEPRGVIASIALPEPGV